MSNELWFAEGFTSYYTGLTIRRAGLTSDEEYAASLSGTVNAVVNSPGRNMFSAVEMSQRAPFVDASTFIDPTNFGNTFLSYYTWGSGIGLALDLTLRERYQKTLDDFMRLAWNKFGTVMRPYTVRGLVETLAELTGDDEFAESFFARYIEGTEVVDYAALLSSVGFELRKANPDGVDLGAPVTDVDDGVLVSSYSTIGGTLYLAGLDNGALITTVNGKKASVKRLHAAKPGEQVSIEFSQRGLNGSTTFEMQGDKALSVVTYESINKEVTSAQRTRRSAWLASRAN